MGVAKIDLRITIAAMLIQGADVDQPAGWTPSFITAIMACLPHGSTVVGFKDYGQQDLAYAYEVLVYNKMFKQGGKIEVEFNRNYGVDPKTGALIQFTEFKGLNLTQAIVQAPEEVASV